MNRKTEYAGNLRARVEVRLTGREPERCIRLCSVNGIELRRLCRGDDEESYHFVIWADEFFALRPYLKKTGCRAKIVSREGMPFYLRKKRRRFLFPAGVLAGAALLAGLSQFVWRIDLEGNLRCTDDMLYRFLESRGVRFGTPKSALYCEELEEELRGAFPEIIWTSVQLEGTHITVSVKENDQPEAAVPEETPADVVALQDGVVTSVIVRSGQTSLKEGDPVLAGQILISGELEIRDDSGGTASVRRVHADGEVYASVSYQYEDRFLLSHEERIYTGETAKRITLVIGGLRIPLPLIGPKAEFYDAVTETRQLYLGSNYYFPAALEETVCRNYLRRVETYSAQEAEDFARERMEAYLEKLSEKGYEIQEYGLSVSLENGVCSVSGSYRAVSQIGALREIGEAEAPDAPREPTN